MFFLLPPFPPRGSTYNIPVCFWLLDDYPSRPPMAFVKPTRDMQIRASSVVDLNGLVSLAYLKEWNCASSNLLELVRACTVAFGESPPVFTKPKSQRGQNGQNGAAAAHITRQSSEQHERRQCSATNQVRRSYSARGQDEEEAGSDDIGEEYLRASLVSATEQKVKQKLEEEFSKTRAELDALHSTNRELLDGQEKVAAIIRELEEAGKEAEERTDRLRRAEGELGTALERLSVSVSVDDLVVVSPGDVGDFQRVEAVAEDAAVDDAVFALGRALQERAIECDVYLRRVRELSRRQFRQRAIVAACEHRKCVLREQQRQQQDQQKNS